MLNIDFIDFMKGMQKLMPVKPSGSEIERIIQQFVADNLKLVAFLVIPFQAIASRYIFFRKSKFNFVEHMVLLLFAFGHLYWISIISALYYKLNGALWNNVLQLGITIFYLAFAYTSFITYQSKWKSFFKGISVYLTGQLLFMLTISLVMVIYVLIISVTDPDSLQLFRPKN